MPVEPIAAAAPPIAPAEIFRAAPALELPRPAPRLTTVRSATDRRQGDRRGMEALRAEALQQVITQVEDKNFGGLRNRIHWIQRIPRQRLVLVVVALCAGGVAAWLATQNEQPAAVPVAPVVVAAPVAQILVAKQAIGTGQKLSPAALEWVDWPEAQLRPEFLTIAASPAAATDLAGQMARSAFVAGEPIRRDKLAPAGQGFLASILDSGMRGVSVSVAADSASGGFVVPNDHVDVVLTRSLDTGQSSQTILSDVRVLAINAQLGPNAGGAAADASSEAPADPSTQVFSNTAIATLALDPAQAEMIINAGMSGKLSLMLRPSADGAPSPDAGERAANAAIRLSSPFWKN